jgi:hypothetical protein
MDHMNNVEHAYFFSKYVEATTDPDRRHGLTKIFRGSVLFEKVIWISNTRR